MNFLYGPIFVTQNQNVALILIQFHIIVVKFKHSLKRSCSNHDLGSFVEESMGDVSKKSLMKFR